MTIITDNDLHDRLCQICIDSIICHFKTELMFDLVRTTPDLAMSIIRDLATDLGFSHRRKVTLTQKQMR